MNAATQRLLETIDQHLPWQLEHYRQLHRHPELSMQEHATAAHVEETLRALGLEPRRVGGTGVVAVIENGAGPTVLARADMDALPVTEATGLDYASETPGVMHACAHDSHVAGLLGAARALTEHRDVWQGTYVAVFQPGEESAEGAQAMVDDGLTELVPRPDACFACHSMPGPAGELSVSPGPVMSAADTIHIVLHGRGGHGSMPHLAVDPAVLASSVVMRLQGIVSRELEPGTFAVVTVGSMQVGSSANVIADRAELQLNVRTFSEATRTQVLLAIERIVRAECAASGSPREPELRFEGGFSLTDNDPEIAARLFETFASAFGEDATTGSRVPASEDFSVIPAAFDAPYCYWFVGSTNRDDWSRALAAGTVRSEVPANHSPRFAPDPEPTLQRIAASHAIAALSVFGSERPPADGAPEAPFANNHENR